MASQFHYSPLSPSSREIRLVTMAPGLTETLNDDTLECALTHTSLPSASPDGLDLSIEYETVSYVWGDANRRAFIYLDRELVSVPWSSEQVLRSVRRSDRPRTIWIDAVCINQSDLVERSQQVAIMADIYRSGSQNIVYLGNHDRTLDAALSSARSLLRTEIADAIAEGRSFLDFMHDPSGQTRLSTARITVDVDQTALLDLFSNPWFR